MGFRYPVYCINLASAETRWKNMTERCHGLDLKRWEADTPETMLGDGEYASYLTMPQRACASSHIRLWRHFLNETDHSAILILEDDAVFIRGWQPVVEHFLDRHEEWDAVFLNVSECIEPLYEWVVIGGQCLTAGYILSREGASFLLDRFRNEYFASDFMTQVLQARGRCYSYFPWLIIQDGTPSTIQEDNSPDFKKVLRILSEYGMGVEEYFGVKAK